MIRFRPPVREVDRDEDGPLFVVDIGDDEVALVRKLVGELRIMLTDDDALDDSDRRVLLVRLFPVVHPDDEELEAEYQRLMREELVASKLAAFDIVEAMLSPKRTEPATEGELVAFMQALNSIRLVLGTMLGVTDDPDADEVTPGLEDSPEYHLYGYLSWLLEWCVRALSGTI